MSVIKVDDFECVSVWSGEVREAVWTGPHVTGAVLQGHQSTGGQGQLLLFVVVAVVIVRGGDVMGTHNIQILTFNAYIHIYFDVY